MDLFRRCMEAVEKVLRVSRWSCSCAGPGLYWVES